MDAPRIAIAEKCLKGAENGDMNFPQIVAILGEAGFDGYLIDYRRSTATYYLSDGDSIVFDMDMEGSSVAAVFRADVLKVAIVEAQTGAPGYTYRGFCVRAKSAGCAGYLVSLGGRKVLYFGRSGEAHTEHMPAS